MHDIKNGDWGLGIGDWRLGPIPNPQSPIPNPQSPLKEEKKLLSCVFLYLKYENIIAINANESLDNYRSYHFNT